MDRQIITVDIAPGSNAQMRLLVSQGDIGRPLGVRVIQNGAPLDCSDYTAFLYVLKPDHNYYECTCTVEDDSLICWETAEQETPVAGECLAAIRIMDQDTDIGTATFVEFVEASPADLGYASESLVSSMTEFVDAAQRAAEEATQAVADVDNVSDVAVNASGHIVLTKVLGSTVESDETVLQPADIENDLLATTAGKVLDARQGKALKDLIDGLDEDLEDLSETVTAMFGKIPTKIFDTAVVAEEALATMPNDQNWMVAFSNASYTGDLKDLCEGVCYVVQFAMGDGFRVQIAFSINNNRVFWRRKNWWTTDFNGWRTICTDKATTGTIERASNITSGGTLDMMVCRRIGDIVIVSARLWGISETALGNFFVIPEGFRPSYEVWTNGYVSVSGQGARASGFRISTNGVVYVGYSSSTTTDQVFFSATYHV